MNGLGNIQMVLVKPQQGGNVGSAARAMKNMGLTKLVLVDPIKTWQTQAKIFSANAFDVLRHAHIYSSVEKAVLKSSFIVGTTRRGGRKRSPEEWSPKTADLILRRARKGVVSILFGNERIGLTDREMSLTDLNIVIPSSLLQPSLNVAQAVMLVGYELFLASGSEQANVLRKDDERYRVSEEILDEMCALLEPALLRLGFSAGSGSRSVGRILHAVRQTAKKSSLEIKHVRMIEGLARRVMDLAEKKREALSYSCGSSASASSLLGAGGSV